MPIHEFLCPEGHLSEKLFLTFGAAEGVEHIDCKECGRSAKRVEFSVPLPGMFFGNPDGYEKPSPLKRYSNKLVAQSGNDSAIG